MSLLGKPATVPSWPVTRTTCVRIPSSGIDHSKVERPIGNQQEELCLDDSRWTSYRNIQRDILYDLFSMYACLSPSADENALMLCRRRPIDGDVSSEDEYSEDEEDEDEDVEEFDEYGGIDSGIDDEDDEDDEDGACQLVTCQGVRVI